MNSLTNVIYQLSTAMLIPVATALLILFGWSLFTLGGFSREWRIRKKHRREWTLWMQGFKKLVKSMPVTQGPSWVTNKFLASIQTNENNPAVLEKMLADLEVESSGRLAKMSFGVRIGPLLGLMGTLIPMGPALLGLSQGNIESMAQNLVIVFSTTVVGVFVGGLCYSMLLVRRQWYAQDLSDIEFLVGRIADTYQAINSTEVCKPKEPQHA